jgi:HEAT repeat protein
VPTPPAAGSSTSAASGPTASGEPAKPTTPTTASASPTPAPTPGPLRDLAARYVQSNPAGGWRVNEQAATELEKLDLATAENFVPLLADRQVEVRRGAAFFLVDRFDPNKPEHVDAFAKALADSDRTVRGMALTAAKRMRPEDQLAAAPQLAALLDPPREDNPDNRASAARLLGSLKSHAADEADKLAAAAQGDPEAKVRSACYLALVQIVPPERLVEPLVHGLADKDAAVRLVAAARLRSLGSAAAPAVKGLAAALEDADGRVSNAAAEALVNIGKDAVGPVAEKLASQKVQARRLALACLAKIGPEAASALPAVEKCLQDSDAQVKELAAAAIARIKM